MGDDYLWDRTGEADPEITRLEAALSRYAFRSRQKRARLRLRIAIAVAASLVLFAAAIYRVNRSGSLSEWRIAGQQLAVGQTVETSGNGPTSLVADAIGEVTLDRHSRLRVLRAGEGTPQLALQQGTIHALIWAPPARFAVETPSARTVDLGCSYTLTVQDDQSGLLTVQMGWVAFQAGARESFIPAGAACHTRPRLGPGLPYFENASEKLRTAVSTFDATSSRASLDEILGSARKEDALTLWHLIIRTSGRDRDAVVQRFADLVPGSDAAGLASGDVDAVDHAWNLLGLGATDWWRQWKHTWKSPSVK